MASVGDKIRMQRVIKNYTQEYMAFELDISQAAYSKIERGEVQISLSRLYAIAEILEISAFDLMPKPKYGFGINLFGVAQWFYKLKNRLIAKETAQTAVS